MSVREYLCKTRREQQTQLNNRQGKSTVKYSSVQNQLIHIQNSLTTGLSVNEASPLGFISEPVIRLSAHGQGG